MDENQKRLMPYHVVRQKVWDRIYMAPGMITEAQAVWFRWYHGETISR